MHSGKIQADYDSPKEDKSIPCLITTAFKLNGTNTSHGDDWIVRGKPLLTVIYWALRVCTGLISIPQIWQMGISPMSEKLLKVSCQLSRVCEWWRVCTLWFLNKTFCDILGCSWQNIFTCSQTSQLRVADIIDVMATLWSHSQYESGYSYRGPVLHYTECKTCQETLWQWNTD